MDISHLKSDINQASLDIQDRRIRLLEIYDRAKVSHSQGKICPWVITCLEDSMKELEEAVICLEESKLWLKNR